ncbi:MAG: HAD family phosphatase [Phycisphaerae bacterium]|nr:HAD family phosphatase [Phycisphaerae bacterium]
MTSPARRFDAVICDIDGCLAAETSAPFDAAALATIADYNRLARDRGDRPVVTLCSGRPEPFVEAMCRLIGNETLPCIAENGVWMFHPAVNGYDMDPRIEERHLVAVEEARGWVRRDLGPMGVVMQPGKAASISLYHERTEVLRGMEGRVREEFARRGWPLRVSMTWLYINCDLEHVSKGTAIDRWTRATGIGRERLAGFGDTAGDLMIADRVAWFGCPANAAEVIKARADLRAASAEVAGVMEFLDRLVG